MGPPLSPTHSLQQYNVMHAPIRHPQLCCSLAEYKPTKKL
uniref:Uncharacterized protein n=1 Tax=Rhizophora mucronata TaxID=61149 RepID=A0A2P2QEJ4_RHIMU